MKLLRTIKRFLTIGTYPCNSDMARLQALVWALLIAALFAPVIYKIDHPSRPHPGKTANPERIAP